MIDLKTGDVYYDKDKQLVVVVQDYSTKEMFLVSFHSTTTEFLSFSSTLGRTKDVTAHLSTDSIFLFNLYAPFNSLLKQVKENGD